MKKKMSAILSVPAIASLMLLGLSACKDSVDGGAGPQANTPQVPVDGAGGNLPGVSEGGYPGEGKPGEGKPGNGKPGDGEPGDGHGHDGNEYGDYHAEFDVLNSTVAGPVTGAAHFKIDAATFSAAVSYYGAAPGIMHTRAIQAGAKCPGPEADINHDGFIDAVEGQAVYGKTLVPLDGDLTSQAAGRDPIEIADEHGNQSYLKSTPWDAFIADLTAVDTDAGDSLVKLETSRLELTQRRVVLFGVAENTVLPSTVQGLPGLSPQASLPIACGEIKLVP